MNQFYTNALLPVYYGPVLGTKYRGGGDDFNSDNMIIGSLIDPRLMGSRTVGYEGRVRWDFSEVRSVNYFLIITINVKAISIATNSMWERLISSVR